MLKLALKDLRMTASCKPKWNVVRGEKLYKENVSIADMAEMLEVPPSTIRAYGVRNWNGPRDCDVKSVATKPRGKLTAAEARKRTAITVGHYNQRSSFKGSTLPQLSSLSSFD